MVTEMKTRVRYNSALALHKEIATPRITILHCVNALTDVEFPESSNYQIQSIKLPCSGMTREVVMLHAFEAGADAVLIFLCPEGSCHYLQGNIRAHKRVARVKKMLDAIGLDGRRLNVYSIPHGDQAAADRIIQKTLADIALMGPNPAI